MTNTNKRTNRTPTAEQIGRYSTAGSRRYAKRAAARADRRAAKADPAGAPRVRRFRGWND